MPLSSCVILKWKLGHLHEELELGAESGDTGHTSHVMELKTWIRDLEKWLVRYDALGQLSEGHLGDQETKVLKARLCQMGVSYDDDGVEAQHDLGIPLSGEPLAQDETPSQFIQEVTERWEATPAGPLQTVTISSKEFLENLEEWRPSAVEELSSIFDSHKALERATQKEIDDLVASGVVVEILPAKAIFQRRAGTGRHKTRVVACGNFESGAGQRSTDKKLSHYAGTLDGVAMRAQLRSCGRKIAAGDGWIAALADVKTSVFACAFGAAEQNYCFEAAKSSHSC